MYTNINTNLDLFTTSVYSGLRAGYLYKPEHPDWRPGWHVDVLHFFKEAWIIH